MKLPDFDEMMLYCGIFYIAMRWLAIFLGRDPYWVVAPVFLMAGFFFLAATAYHWRYRRQRNGEVDG